MNSDKKNNYQQNEENSSLKSQSQLSNLIDAEELYKSQKHYKPNSHMAKPIHLEPLEIQQKRLFEAFFKGDQHYIYEFDKETYSYREKYMKKLSQQGLTAGLYTIGINAFIYTQIFKNKQYNIASKIASLTLLNAIPLGYFAYSMLIDYNKANDFLFNKYLNKIE